METRIRVLEKIYRFLDANEVCFLYGGAMAGKSYAVMQYIILKMLAEKDLRVFIFRKYSPSVRISSWRLFLDLVEQYGLEDTFRLNHAIMEVEGPRGNLLLMRGLDDSEKIKSVEADVIWFEEATEFSYEDFVNALLRLRRKLKKFILTFNPIYRDWILESMKKYPSLKVSFRDNPFISEKEKEILYSLKGVARKVYLEGEFARNENVVFQKYAMVDDTFHLDGAIEIAGIDFGFTNPTAVVFLEVNHFTKKIYVKDEIYVSGLTNSDLIQILREKPNILYYCDSSEPQRIRELQAAGIKALPAVKTKIPQQIRKLLEYDLYVNSKCENTLKEISVYSWKVRNEVVLDEVEETFYDHAIDAMRYAVYTSSLRSPKVEFFIGGAR